MRAFLYFIIILLLFGTANFQNVQSLEMKSGDNIQMKQDESKLFYVINNGEYSEDIISYTSDHRIFFRESKITLNIKNNLNNLDIDGYNINFTYRFNDLMYNQSFIFDNDIHQSPVYQNILIFDHNSKSKIEILESNEQLYISIDSNSATNNDYFISADNVKTFDNINLDRSNKINKVNESFILPISFKKGSTRQVFSIKSTFLGGSEDDRIIKT